MMTLKRTMIEAWTAACIDKPIRPSAKVVDGKFVMTLSGQPDRWNDLCLFAGVPPTATKTISADGASLLIEWESHADTFFGEGGVMAHALPGYEPRIQQLHMARLVQRSIEMKTPAMAEAGTGVGKSFAYLVIGLRMKTKMLVAAPTVALQSQLVRKDLPFLLSLEEFADRKIAFVAGKSRYVCLHKAEDQTTGSYAIRHPQFIEWMGSPDCSGNLEEITFELSGDERAAVNADDECLRRHCPRYAECFYYRAKQAMRDADIVVCNHSLLALHKMYEGAGILPDNAGAIVIDEAHQFPRYVMSALGAEFTFTGIDRALKRIERRVDDVEKVVDALNLFKGEVANFLFDKKDSEVGIRRDRVFEGGLKLASQMRIAADEVWSEAGLPSSEDEMLLAAAARAVRSMAENVRQFSSETREAHVRLIKQERDRLVFNNIPFDVSQFIAGYAGTSMDVQVTREDHTRCTRCHRKLTAEKVAILNDKPFGPECIQVVDLFGDAEVVPLIDWLNQPEPEEAEPIIIGAKPIVFTSATLAAPDMASFKKECGLEDVLELIAASPFDYRRNALLFVPGADAPLPDNQNRHVHLSYTIDTMERLVLASDGGAFLLFTSNSALRESVQQLRPAFERQGMPVLVQGDLPKMEIVRRFKQSPRSVLFATKSFWEGIDVQGEGLRLVVIDKLPFEAPNPLNTAQEDALRSWAEQKLGLVGNKLKWFPFEAMRVPKMIIDLKQGSGRLIRTRSDYGVIAILDGRIRTTYYGRRSVVPALPPAPMTENLSDVAALFASRRPAPSAQTIRAATAR